MIFIGVMFRILKHYNINLPYDGISPDVNCAKLRLDPIDVAGSIRLKKLIKMRELKLSKDLLALTCVTVFTCLIVTAIVLEDTITAKKWKPHLQELIRSSILRPVPKSEIKSFSKYFAVPKSGGSCRAIFNAKRLSAFFKRPETTNLPEIDRVLELIEEYGQHWIVGDWRHFFHQIRLETEVSKFFGIECGGDTFCWSTLPMGFSHSPHLAQTVAWCILLEAAFRAELVAPEQYQDLVNTPSFVILKDNQGVLLVWYDNVLALFRNVSARDKYYTALLEVTGTGENGVNCIWRNLERFSLSSMGPNRSPSGPPVRPIYLGMEFSRGTPKRDRHGNLRDSVQWRHDPGRLERWTDLTTINPRATPRVIARAVGVLLWDATVTRRPLCEESAVIDELRGAADRVHETGWDGVPAQNWSPETISRLEDATKMLNP